MWCSFFLLFSHSLSLLLTRQGPLEESSVTGRLEPKEAPAWQRRAFRYLVSFPIIGLCLVLVFVVMFLMLRLQVFRHNLDVIRHPPRLWSFYVERTLRKSPEPKAKKKIGRGECWCFLLDFFYALLFVLVTLLSKHFYTLVMCCLCGTLPNIIVSSHEYSYTLTVIFRLFPIPLRCCTSIRNINRLVFHFIVLHTDTRKRTRALHYVTTNLQDWLDQHLPYSSAGLWECMCIVSQV